jgi:putative ABC transport system permease protein
LALGIGANAAVFSIVHSVLLRALPYAEPDRLFLLAETNPERNWDRAQVAPANFLDWQEQARSFGGVGGMAGFGDWTDQVVLSAGDTAEPEVINAKAVAGDLFGVLGVPMALGRSFRAEELWSTAEPVVVLSNELWRTRFASDATIVGRPIRLNGKVRTVVGVLPPGFRLDGSADVWRPFGWDPEARSQVWFRRAHMFRGVGRLAPGATLESASGEMKTIAARLEKTYPQTNTGMGVVLVPFSDHLVGEARRPLALLFVGVLLVLLVACVNVAHLQLARASALAHEDSLRGCLGASRWRQARRRLVESLLLSSLGAVAGTACAWVSVPLLVRMGGAALPGFAQSRAAGAVVTFALLLALVAAVVSGMAPALRGGSALERSLREGAIGAGEGRRGGRLRAALVACELALATVVVTGALLLVRSLGQLQGVDPGFESTNVLTAGLSVPPSSAADDAALGALYARFLDRVRAIPGVDQAGLVRALPLTNDHWSSDFAVEGRGREEFGIEVVHREVSPGYFQTLGVPLVAGRHFNDADDAAAPAVVVINRALADRFFPQGDAIGRRLCYDRYPDANSVWRTVVGVVGDERQDGLAQPPRIEIFAPLAQDPTRRASLVVRSGRPKETLTTELRAVLAATDRQLPLFEVRSLAEVRHESTRRERFLLTLFSLFAGLAMVLSAIGVYGVTAQAALRRRREIGVRMAVGAGRSDVAVALVRRFLIPVAVGLALGLAGSVFLGSAMQDVLFGLGRIDPASLATAPALLLVTAAAAMWWPVRRALRTPPSAVLRGD